MKTTKRQQLKTASKSTPPAATGEDLLELDQALALLKTSRPTFYRWVRTGKIKGTKVGRQWRFRRADLDRFLKGEEPAIALPVSLQPLTEALQDYAKRAHIALTNCPPPWDILTVTTMAIYLAHQMRVSDLHLMPAVNANGERTGQLRFRIDGAMRPVVDFDIRLLPALVERWKIMANCNVHETRKCQDGRILVRIAGKEVDMRVSFLSATLGESVTCRILDRDAVALQLDQLPHPPRVHEQILRHLAAPQGLIIVSGPTGSGKTTSLYACLAHVARPEKKVITVEDPVEFMLPGILHTNLMESVGMTFAATVRAVLRAAPDVLMIGEIRDRETLQMGLYAAISGHLILTTLHTPDAATTLKRMVDIGVEPFLIGDATRLVLSQRLIRKLCPHCARPFTPGTEQLLQATQIARAGGLDWDALPRTFREPVGCSQCHGVGLRGRTVIVEALEMTPEISGALVRQATVEELRSLAVKQGMVPLAAHAIQRAAAGEATLAEALAMARL